MNTLVTSLCAAFLAFCFSPTSPQPKSADLTAEYHRLAASGSQAELIELWRENETEVLGTIDRDLEGGLAIWEKARAEDPEQAPSAADLAQIAELSKRALFGARAASEAFQRPIFSDYASAFLSWNTENKLAFRAGQAAFGKAVQAIRNGDFETARDQGERCTELALPLGDWWGTAMGLGISGSAYLELGDFKRALSLLSQARLLNQALGLTTSELRNLDGMLSCLETLGHERRAADVCRVLIAKTSGATRAAYEERASKLDPN